MKQLIRKFHFIKEACPEIIRALISEYSDFIVQQSGNNRALNVDSPQDADTVFSFRIIEGYDRDASCAEADEWYRIRSEAEDNGNRKTINIEAHSEAGLKWGIADLFKLTGNDPEGPWIEYPLDMEKSPVFSKRCMHPNGWVYNHPYSFRSWSLSDWKDYIDIMFLMKVNLLMIWPFMETIPLPLSAGDEKYLTDYRKIIDYARGKYGMEVWIFMSPNRICVSDEGISDPRLRPYWYPHVQVDMNPADPYSFKLIHESRKVLFECINNADGYCMIDSDPGYWAGSPTEEYIKICKDNRALIDECSIFGKNAKLIVWTWVGWGSGSKPEANFIDTLKGLKEEIHEPWLMIASYNSIGEYLKYDKDLCRKFVFVHYGAIEAEPSIPFTNNDLRNIDAILKSISSSYENLLGIMGNAQSPVLQLPNTYCFFEKAWNSFSTASPERTGASNTDNAQNANNEEKEMLTALSSCIFPEHAGLLAEAWMMLEKLNPSINPMKEYRTWLWESSPNSMLSIWKAPDIKEVHGLISKLEGIRKKTGIERAGAIGRKIPGSPGLVIEDLILQLKIACSAEEGYGSVLPETPREEWLSKVETYFGYVAELAAKTGFKGIIPPRHWQRIGTLLRENVHISGRRLEWEELVPMQDRLRAKFGKKIADYLVCALHNELLIDDFDIKAGEPE